MSIKKLTKRIWYGSDTTVNSEGKTVAAAPPIATNDGSEDWDLNGLVIKMILLCFVWVVIIYPSE